MPLNSESNITLMYQPGNCLQEAILVLLSEFHSKKYTPFNRIFKGKKGRTFKRGDGKLSMLPIASNKSTFFSYWGGSNSTGDKDCRKTLYSSILHIWKIRVLFIEKGKVFKNLAVTYMSFMKSMTCCCFKNMLFDVSVQALLWSSKVK